MKKTCFVTTPIYYASGPLHLGHIYCTTVAKTISNYKKIMGYDVKFLTGSDEHGQKIEQKAKLNNKSPKEYVDDLVLSYKDVWKKWHIDYDYFSRTTSAEHIESVSDIFELFLQKGLIYRDKYNGLYSVEDEEFLTESQATKKDDEFFHPVSGHKLINVSEDSYFFDINRFITWWKNEIVENPDFLSPQKILSEVNKNFINEGIENLSVTRQHIKWGIPVKSDSKHILYVWLDALFNYITALGYSPNNSGQDYIKYWENGNEIIHIIGKEISRFHFIYWPIFCKALNIKIPSKIYAHGLLRDKDGRKMSKSLNNVIDPDYLLNKYDHEMVKYYLTTQITFGEDGNFSEEKLIDTVNSDLVNNYGNLISRTLKMISNSFPNGMFYRKNSKKEHIDIEQKIESFSNKFISFMDDFKIDKALSSAMKLSDALNKYIDELKPWLLKNDSEKNELESILIRLLHGIYAISWGLQIVIPEQIKNVAKALNIKTFELDKITDMKKFDNHKMTDKFILYSRIKK
ncbi:methionine--tRNA ligase [Mycoplasma sp. U97]|uniref:methionine--tRNA ligase n=1 Tax=Mycoplasma tauri TaxID=547987 RepID=UPI001CBBCBD5|nr:methionine--tRNA ligase [Mycoplasma tauri]MBZ4212573.1 methionine--tRNA ligase [Mycoplasma tauri]